MPALLADSLPTDAVTAPAPIPAAAPLTFEERLALASIRIDTRLADHGLSEPLPVAEPLPSLAPLTAPVGATKTGTDVAATLARAAELIVRRGWMRGRRTDADGRLCMAAAVETAGGASAGAALAHLTDYLREALRDMTATIPSVNDSGTGADAVRLLGEAARWTDNPWADGTALR